MNFNIPNKFTTVRLILITPMLICMYIGGLCLEIVAAFIFIIASITDYYDGYFARKLNLGTSFGKIFDHSADKGLITSSLIMLLYLDRIDPFLAIILVLRDILVNGIRISAASKQLVIGARLFGKWKTALQMIALPAIFVNPEFIDLELFDWIHKISYCLLWVSVVFSIASGFDYYKSWKQVMSDKESK